MTFYFTRSLAPSPQCSIHNRKVSLLVCDRAWESPYGNPGRIALCARGLSNTVEKLPRQRAAFQPAGSLRPDQQHQAVRVRRNGRMLSTGAFAGRSEDCRHFECVPFDFLEVNLTRLFPRGEYLASAFAQIPGAHGTSIQFPTVNPCITTFTAQTASPATESPPSPPLAYCIRLRCGSKAVRESFSRENNTGIVSAGPPDWAREPNHIA